MAGFTTIDSVLYRGKLMLVAYLQTEVTLIDTRNNAVAVAQGDTAGNFTTAVPAAAAITLYAPGESVAKATRIVLTDEGETRNNELQFSDFDGVNAWLPRFDASLAFGVEIQVASNTQTGDRWHARRQCNRLALGCKSVFERFKEMAVPSSTLSGFEGTLHHVTDSRPADEHEDAWQRSVRKLKYELRLIENRA